MSARHSVLLAWTALAGLGCTGEKPTGDPPFSGSTGFTTNGSSFGSTGTASGFFGYGSASISNSPDDGFGFTPQGATVTDVDGHATLSRAEVLVTTNPSACRSEDYVNVKLTFGDPTVPLTAGSYLVDGGATIVWGAGTQSGGQHVAAVEGIINCNSISGSVVAGSFIAQMPLDDGGLSSLTGIFTSTSCQSVQ